MENPAQFWVEINSPGKGETCLSPDLCNRAVKIGKQRTKYTPTGRKPPGPKGRLEKAADRRRAEAAARAQHAAE